jgi:hypothetical protein
MDHVLFANGIWFVEDFSQKVFAPSLLRFIDLTFVTARLTYGPWAQWSLCASQGPGFAHPVFPLNIW